MTPGPRCDSFAASKTFWGLIAGIIAVRLVFVLLLPSGQNVRYHLEGLNDEPAHYNYVKYLAVNHAFPVLTTWVLDKDAFVRNEFEYHQAPLYYLFCVPLFMVFGDHGGLIACRLLSLMFGVLGMLVGAGMLRDLGHGLRIQLGAVVVGGLLFPYLYFTSLASNDSLSWFLALALLRVLLRSMREEQAAAQWRTSGTIAFLCAAGLLTKSSFLLFLPLVAGAYAYAWVRSRDSRIFLHGAVALCAAGLCALPWYVRNIALYHSLSGMPVSTSVSGFGLPVIVGFVKGTIKFFWFPMQHLKGGAVPFAVLTFIGGGIIAAHGIVAMFWMARRISASSAFLLCSLGAFGGAAFWYYMEWQNPEARFLFPAFGAILFFLIVPIGALFERSNKAGWFLPYLCAVTLFPYLFLIWAG